jgi:hypothetical protein
VVVLQVGGLVTLRGIHLLDVLVVVSVEACKKIMRCFREELVRGIVHAPREPRRATLVEHVKALCLVLIISDNT